MRDDSGSATVWWISMCLVLWFLTYAVLATSTARMERDRAGAAADLAALAAAARAHQGVDPACAVAGETAEANGADLDSCDLSGQTVTVTVSLPSSVLPIPVGGRARAGPVHDSSLPSIPPIPADAEATPGPVHDATEEVE